MTHTGQGVSEKKAMLQEHLIFFEIRETKMVSVKRLKTIERKLMFASFTLSLF